MIVNNQTRCQRHILDSHYLDTKGLEQENQDARHQANILILFRIPGGDEGI
jgi:hypothetical protein